MAITVVLGSITFGGAADSDGDRFTLRELAGWTTPPVDLVLVDKPAADGAVIAYGRYKARTVVISGHAVAATRDASWRVRSKLATAANLVSASGTLTVNEPTAVYTLSVRLAEAIRDRQVGLRVVEFEITLVAANPTKTLVTP